MASSSISSLAETRALRDRLQAAGRRLVFTNGVFDLLHAGHVRYLAQARALGDALVVALNSDESVRALKGPSRPLNTAADRAEVLLGLRSVDAVVVFDGERCTAAITAIQPHVYAKGGDYTPDSLNREEKAALDAADTTLHILELVPGRSTTDTIRKMNEPTGTPAGARRTRLAVLGSGQGSNFEALLAAMAAGTIEAEVTLVLSDRADARILRLAREAGIPAVYVDPGSESNKLDDAAQKEICDRLRASGAELVILAGFMKRLREPVHPSLLPAYPGREAWVQAWTAGATETGCTVHLVDAEIDSGRLLAQARVPILPTDDAEAVRARINSAEQVLYPQAIANYAATLA